MKLPIFGPPLVVRDVGVQSSHQGSVFTLRSEIRIHLPQAGLEAKFHNDLLELLSQRSRLRHDHVRIGAFWNLRDVDHVDVAHIVQLPGTRLAHGNDGEGHIILGQRQLGPSN